MYSVVCRRGANELALKAVVDGLGEEKKLRCALDDEPISRKADIIHERRQTG